MCSGGFAKCLGICLIPLAIVCILCNILLFFPGGTVQDSDHITIQAFYFGGIVGSGVLMIFPALVFLGLKNNDCCGCCGNESCGRRFAMLSSILFAAVGVLGAGYSVIVSAVAINHGPKCLMYFVNSTVGPTVGPTEGLTTATIAGTNASTIAGTPAGTRVNSSLDATPTSTVIPTVWGYPFSNGNYLKDPELRKLCLGPDDIINWHLSLFSVLLVMGLIQVALCAVQVINGLLGALCGDCCGCCGGSDGAV